MAAHYHEGELAVQERAGVADEAERVGEMVGDAIPPRALSFLAAQTMLVLATSDADGQPWGSLVSGAPGFARSRDGTRLDVALHGTDPDDPLWRNLESGGQVGMLAIELATRKRLRVNGRAELVGRHTLSVEVEAAYPNCPKYIQRRLPVVHAGPLPSRPVTEGERLGPDQLALVRRSDTLFVASRHPSRGADASHRGGNPGFVEVGATTLRIPDYVGNTMFNTLGNLAVEPRAGLLVVDFSTRRLLELIGATTTHFQESAARGHTGYVWELAVSHFREHDLPSTMTVGPPESSPFNPPV